MTTTRFPRLMSSDLKELGYVEPLSLSIEMNLTPPSTAVMTLPPDVPIVQTGQFMELYTPQGSAGIFRVEQVERSYPAPTRVTLTHALTTLSDSLIFSAEETTLPATDFFRSILAQQSLWQPGQVTLPEDARITWRSEAASLLEALTALLQEFPDYCLTFDQTASPWTLNLLPLTEECSTECRLTRNLRSLTVETDRSDLCTQLYLPGIDEPLQADTLTRWGKVSRSLAADAGLTPEELTTRGQQYLEQHKNPQITVTLDALELSTATGSSLDSFHLGKLCRICLPEEGTTLLHRIVTMTYPDVYGAPETIRVALSNSIRNASSVLAGLIVDSTQVKKQVVRQWNALSDQKDLIISAEESITLLSKDITLHAEEILTLQAGVGDNLAQIILMDGRITANAREIDLHASDILTLRSGVDDNAAQISLMDGRIAANAREIDLHANDILTLRSGVDDNLAQITLMEGRISANAREIDLHASDILTLRSGVDDNLAQITLMDGRISANAREIDLHANDILTLRSGVDDNAAAVILANQTITANAEAIALKADQASLDLINGRIDAQAREINLKADKIDLQGYVTMEDFASISGWTDHFSGDIISANSIGTGSLDADEISFGDLIGSRANIQESLTIQGETAATQAWVKSQYMPSATIISQYPTTRYVAETYIPRDGLTTETVNVVKSVGLTKEYDSIPGADGLTHVVISSVTVSYSTEEITYVKYA